MPGRLLLLTLLSLSAFAQEEPSLDTRLEARSIGRLQFEDAPIADVLASISESTGVPSFDSCGTDASRRRPTTADVRALVVGFVAGVG